jgi:hypothetical protein
LRNHQLSDITPLKGLVNLEILHLSLNGFETQITPTDNNLEVLRGLINLRQLWIRGISFCRALINELQEILVECDITYSDWAFYCSTCRICTQNITTAPTSTTATPPISTTSLPINSTTPTTESNTIPTTATTALSINTTTTTTAITTSAPTLTTTSATTTTAAAPHPDSIPISNRAELDSIRNNLDGTFHLTGNIDLQDLLWTPIGTVSNPFTGTFNGQGYIIHNLAIMGNFQNAGLFGVADENAEIRNIGVDGSITMNASVADTVSVGGIIGRGGIVRNSFTNVEIVVTAANARASAGGIIGSNGMVIGSYNLGNISATALVNTAIAGGIGGNNIVAQNCFNRGTVTARANGGGVMGMPAYTGGIVGVNGSVTNVYNIGNTNANGNSGIHFPFPSYVGGIAGLSTVSNSYWNIDSTQIQGGISLTNNNKIAVSRDGSSIATFGLTTNEMKNASSYEGWNFINTWAIDGTNDGFPVLRSASIFVPNITAILPHLPTAQNCEHGNNLQTCLVCNPVTTTAPATTEPPLPACQDCGENPCECGTDLPINPCDDCSLCTLVANGGTVSKGRILGGDRPTIFDALEILKSIVGMSNRTADCGNALYAALIMPNRPQENAPNIFDALEVLKHIVGMTSLAE